MDEARRGYPVRLRGVVAYYDSFLDFPQPILMVMDETGSVFVKLPLRSTLSLRAGDRVLVTGESIVGGFAPDVDRPQVRVLGVSRLPGTAPRRSLTYLLSGAEDAPWVEMEGVVHAVQMSAHEVILKIAGADGNFTAVTPRDSRADYGFLSGARVRLRGLACTLFNNRRQIVGVQLRFAGLDMVKVEEPAPLDPYALTVSRVRALLSFTPGKERDRLAHLRGAVTLFWPGRLLCFEEGRDGLCAQTVQTTPVLPGQTVDVVGFPQIGSYSPTLTDAAFRPADGAVALAPTTAGPERVVRSEYDAQLVQIDGELIGEDKAAGDPTILLAAGKLIFSASLPKSADADRLLRLEPGSRLRVEGICSILPDSSGATDADGYAVARSFRLLMRSSADVTVLERPSWWSAAHTLRVLVAALVAISGVLAWVLVLRKRLQKQAALLQFQATHDSLTGLWNRKAILELLGREWTLTARSHGSLAIMMLDVDHFKQVNDSHGHLAGDAVLKTISERIVRSVRGSELIGRYGGEEFLVVLPGSDEDQVSAVAERVRQTIAEEPVRIDQGLLAVTVSIGTAVIEPLSDTEKDALAAADNALYESKNLGRNRVTVAVTGGRARHHALQAGLSRRERAVPG
jgi:diguanylate cyclase (GGDEF)-like protein